MSLMEQEIVDLKRLITIRNELRSHEICGVGVVAFDEIHEAVESIFRKLYREIGKRTCLEFIEKNQMEYKFEEGNE